MYEQHPPASPWSAGPTAMPPTAYQQPAAAMPPTAYQQPAAAMQYAEVFPHRVRAILLESVFDHGLATRSFLDTQAATAQDSFDEFVAWCARAGDCALHGLDVRRVWADQFARAGRGELLDAAGTAVTPFKLVATATRAFYEPTWSDLARRLALMSDGGPAEIVPMPPLATAAFCADWSLPVRDYREYAGHLRRLAVIAPDMRYPVAVVAISSCLGWPAPVANPQHRLRVAGVRPMLLVNSLHDPATGYIWATRVARQLAGHAVLLSYQGWGHGVANHTACLTGAVERYLISLALPAPGASCPAAEP